MAQPKAAKTEGLMYKGHPLRRVDNLIYYGTMADKYIIMMQVLDTQKVQDLDVATKVSIQLQLTDPDLKSRAEASEEDIAEIIKPCGLFRTKARDIKLGAQKILSDFGGKVPDTMEELLTIPGVGRKTANLILSDIYGKPAIVADTHCMRISGRLGLSPGRDPYKVELALSAVIEPSEQASLCHRFVHFVRDVCTARSPKCAQCPLTDLCDEYAEK